MGNARINFSGTNGSGSSNTTADGSYSVQLFAGIYGFSINTSLSGFNSLSGSHLTQVSITADTTLNFTTPNRYITGTVRDINGQPISGIALSVNNTLNANGVRWSSSASATSAGDGSFLLGVLPTTMSITVRPPTGSVFLPATLQNIVVTGDRNLTIVLLSAAPPDPQANLTISKTASAPAICWPTPAPVAASCCCSLRGGDTTPCRLGCA